MIYNPAHRGHLPFLFVFRPYFPPSNPMPRPHPPYADCPETGSNPGTIPLRMYTSLAVATVAVNILARASLHTIS